MTIELTDIAVTAETNATDFLAHESGLSRSRLKVAMTKGAVWLKSSRGNRRLRRAKARLVPGDLVSLYYSEKILEIAPETPVLVDDHATFSVWIKPAGLMSGGSRFGDHCSINRVVEQLTGNPTFLVHRLDQYVWGLMVLAHSKRAATHLSRQFQERTTRKVYQAIVHGKLSENQTIDTLVDNREAISHVKPVRFDENSSMVEVTIETGRKHQIRQHLSSINHPVVGDRRFGSGDKGGIQLASVELGFESPTNGEWKSYRLPENQKPVFLTQEAK